MSFLNYLASVRICVGKNGSSRWIQVVCVIDDADERFSRARVEQARNFQWLFRIDLEINSHKNVELRHNYRNWPRSNSLKYRKQKSVMSVDDSSRSFSTSWKLIKRFCFLLQSRLNFISVDCFFLCRDLTHRSTHHHTPSEWVMTIWHGNRLGWPKW